MNNLNVSGEQMNTLLNIASKKLGKTPEQLQAELDQGKMDELVKNLDPKVAGQVNGLLKNPKALEAMMGNEKVKNMLENLMGKK